MRLPFSSQCKMANSWELVESETDSDVEEDVGSHGSDRSRSPVGRVVSPITAPPSGKQFVLQPGLSWWAKPLARAIMRSRCGARARMHACRPMAHVSACSGMMTEMLAAQVHKGCKTAVPLLRHCSIDSTCVAKDWGGRTIASCTCGHVSEETGFA
jgi:hypothetical protein